MPGITELLRTMGDPVRPGQPLSEALTAARLNAIMGAIRALAAGENLSSGLNVRMTKGPGGVTIGATGGGSGTVSIEHPFQIVNKSTAGTTPAAKIWVRYGTVQDVAPALIETDSTLSTAATYSVFVEVEVNLAGNIVAAEIGASASGLPANTDYFGYILLGTVIVETSGSGLTVTKINQAATHSLRMAVCGRVVDGPTLTTPGTFEFWGF